MNHQPDYSPACTDATLADLDGLLALEQLVFPPHEAFSCGQYYRLLRSDRVSIRAIRAACDGQIIGSAILLRRLAGPRLVGRIYSIAVSPDHRGRGLGRLLMDDLLTTCRREGVSRLYLEVRQDNVPAIGLYRRYGFEEVARLPDYYGPGEGGLRMRLELEKAYR